MVSNEALIRTEHPPHRITDKRNGHLKAPGWIKVETIPQTVNRSNKSLSNLGILLKLVLFTVVFILSFPLYAHFRNNKTRVVEGWIQRFIGEILLNIDDQHISEAEHWIKKAIEADQTNRMLLFLGNDYALYADLFKRKGDRSKAQENLGKAIEIFKECGADGWVEKAEKELATIS